VMYWFETLGSLEPFLPYHLRISIRRPYDGHTFYGFHVQDDKSLIKATFFRALSAPLRLSTGEPTRRRSTLFVGGYLAEHVPETASASAQELASTPTPQTCISCSLHPRNISPVAAAAGFSPGTATNSPACSVRF
jgi:hypothetical protein